MRAEFSPGAVHDVWLKSEHTHEPQHTHTVYSGKDIPSQNKRVSAHTTISCVSEGASACVRVNIFRGSSYPYAVVMHVCGLLLLLCIVSKIVCL